MSGFHVIFTGTKLRRPFASDKEWIAHARVFFCAHIFPQHVGDEQPRPESLTTHQIPHFAARHASLFALLTDSNTEPKLVRCAACAVHDAILDLCRELSTLVHWMALIHTVDNHCTVPVGIRDGLQALVDGAEALYVKAAYCHPASARSARGVGLAFRIDWPAPRRILLERDRNCLDFQS